MCSQRSVRLRIACRRPLGVAAIACASTCCAASWIARCSANTSSRTRPSSGQPPAGAALWAVAAAVAEGALTPGEACDLSQVAATFIKAIETADFERRLQQIEQRDASRP